MTSNESSPEAKSQERMKGRIPRRNAKGRGYLTPQIKAAEEALQRLEVERVRLITDNERLRQAGDWFATGFAVADKHLLYTSRMHCALQSTFSRQAVALMAREKAIQVKIRTPMHAWPIHATFKHFRVPCRPLSLHSPPLISGARTC